MQSQHKPSGIPSPYEERPESSFRVALRAERKSILPSTSRSVWPSSGFRKHARRILAASAAAACIFAAGCDSTAFPAHDATEKQILATTSSAPAAASSDAAAPSATPDPSPRTQAPSPSVPAPDLSIEVTVMGGLTCRLSPNWTTSKIPDALLDPAPAGTFTVSIPDGDGKEAGTLTVRYEDIGAHLTDDMEADRKTCMQTALDSAAEFGVSALADVAGETSLPYAWFGEGSMENASGTSRAAQFAAFCDGRYLYSVGGTSMRENSVMYAAWPAFLASCRIAGEPVWPAGAAQFL